MRPGMSYEYSPQDHHCRMHTACDSNCDSNVGDRYMEWEHRGSPGFGLSAGWLRFHVPVGMLLRALYFRKSFFLSLDMACLVVHCLHRRAVTSRLLKNYFRCTVLYVTKRHAGRRSAAESYLQLF